MAKKASSDSTGPKKKPAAKKAAATAPAAMQSVDTSLAAENAARMLVSKFNKPAGAKATPAPESAMFRQLKEGLNKPHSAAMSNLLDKSQGPQHAKSHPQMKQVGHNQTYGADVNRTGVPRRTPG